MKDVNNLLNPPIPRSKEFSNLLEDSLNGLRRYYIMHTACELKLFDHTASPKTSQALATELSLHETMTRLFCETLVELGLLNKISDTYINSQLASNYLSCDSPWCMTATLKHMKANADSWANLKEILKNGPILHDKKEIFGDNWLVSIAEWAEAGSVSDALNVIKDNLDIKRWRKLLDLGGGHGLYAIAFTALNTDLEAFVFDLPRIVPLTRRYIENYAAKRVSVIPGDFYKDDIGNGYNAVFSSYNQSCSDPALIHKIVHAVKPDGDVILRRFKDDCREGALKTLNWNLLSFEGKKIGSKPHSSDTVVGREEYLKHLEAAGLKILKVVPVDYMSEMVFARKLPNIGREQ